MGKILLLGLKYYKALFSLWHTRPFCIRLKNVSWLKEVAISDVKILEFQMLV
jgi:hypothetical protein